MSKPATPAFLSQTNIYEVNLRQYSPDGSIRSFLNHLPRLHDMGVEILWMMPIHPIGILKRKGLLGSYYSIKDFCDINPEFGTKEDFKMLVKAVHGLGMKIIIDWVANHASWDNVWTITNPEFFVRDEDGNFKPPFDWDDVIQIDHTSKSEQAAMQHAMEFWVKEFDIDGFRADLAHLTPLPFWVNARKTLDSIKKELVWLAETEDTSYYEAFDITYAWKWMHDSEDFFKQGHDVKSLMALLEKQKSILPVTAMELFFTTNHDENSWNGTEYEKYGIYAQALAVINYTWPNAVPLIYSGQELPNFKRLKFFEKDPIEWAGNCTLHSFYKTLAAFHRNNFTDGELKLLYTQKNILAYHRIKNNRSIFVFLNLEKEKVIADFNVPGSRGNYKNIFSGEMVPITETISIELEPGGFLVMDGSKS